MTEKKLPEKEEKPTATEVPYTSRLFSGGPVNVEFEVSRLGDGGLRDAIERMREMHKSASRLGVAIPAQEADGEGELDELRDEVMEWLVEVPEQSFDDVVGNREALQTLIDAVRAPVEDSELYEHYGLRMPRGALLQGPPGCGKTMFARAVASEMRRLYGDGVEMLSLPGGSMQCTYVGQTEKLIRDVFAFARQYRKVRGHPLLVFIDEAEAILPDRSGKYRRVHSWEQSQVATFLAEMDGLEESGAFVLLASNMPEMFGIRHLLHWRGRRVDLHSFERADLIDQFHSHPAMAIRIVLWGGYVEETLDGEKTTWRPGDIGLVGPEFVHRIDSLLNGRRSVSLWIRGRVTHPIELHGDGWPDGTPSHEEAV